MKHLAWLVIVISIAVAACTTLDSACRDVASEDERQDCYDSFRKRTPQWEAGYMRR